MNAEEFLVSAVSSCEKFSASCENVRVRGRPRDLFSFGEVFSDLVSYQKRQLCALIFAFAEFLSLVVHFRPRGPKPEPRGGERGIIISQSICMCGPHTCFEQVVYNFSSQPSVLLLCVCLCAFAHRHELLPKFPSSGEWKICWDRLSLSSHSVLYLFGLDFSFHSLAHFPFAPPPFTRTKGEFRTMRDRLRLSLLKSERFAPTSRRRTHAFHASPPPSALNE